MKLISVVLLRGQEEGDDGGEGSAQVGQLSEQAGRVQQLEAPGQPRGHRVPGD